MGPKMQSFPDLDLSILLEVLGVGVDLDHDGSIVVENSSLMEKENHAPAGI
jgi:hypothetical protein